MKTKLLKFKATDTSRRSFKEQLEELRPNTKRNLKLALELVNTRHISIRVGRQHAVCDITVPDKGALPQNNSDFVERYRTFVYTSDERTGSGRLKKRKLGDLWLAWEGRRSYDGTLTFTPPGTPGDDADADSCEDDFNLWRGFRVKPSPGDWSLFNTHLFDIVCRGNRDDHEYLLNYFAHMVQFPGRLPKVCVVIQGGQGTGKTHVYDVISSVFHKFNRALLDSPKQVVGNFNMHLAEKVLVCADEAIFARDKQVVGKLKSMITHPEQQFEAKGFDLVALPNCARLIIISNDEHIIHADRDERRYFVLRTADTYAQRPGESLKDANRRRAAYFNPITQQMMQDGGLAAMLFDLLKRNLSDFDLLEFRDTPFLSEQKRLSWEPHEKWLANKLLEGHNWFTEPTKRPSKTHVYDNYKDEAPRYNRRQPVMDDTQFGKFLVAVFGPGVASHRQGRENNKQVAVYWFPPLDESRRLWEQYSGTSGRKIRIHVRRTEAS